MDKQEIIRKIEAIGVGPWGVEMLLDIYDAGAAAEREECARIVEQAGINGYGTLAAAALIRERRGP